MKNTENKNKVYTLTIKDESGEVCTLIEANCILLSANCADGSGTAVTTVIHCKNEDVIKTIMGLDKIKENLIKKNPMIGHVLALENEATELVDTEGEEDEGGIRVVEE